MTITLAEAKKATFARAVKGTHCPCCGQNVKVYRRNLNRSMAWALIYMYRKYGQGWVHVPSTGHLARLGGDWAKMAFWGVIEEKDEQKDDGNPHAGYWRLTALGSRFVLGQRLKKYVYIYNNQDLQQPSPETVSIREALGKKFDYAELMRGPLP